MRLRAWLTALAGCGVALAAAWLVLRAFVSIGSDALRSVSESGPDSAADLLVLCAAALGVLATVWLGAGIVASALATIPGAIGVLGSSVADRLAPAAVRRAVALALGTALSVGAAPLAAVASGSPPTPPAAPGATSAVTLAHPPDPAFTSLGAVPAVDAGGLLLGGSIRTGRTPEPPDLAAVAPDPAFAPATADRPSPTGPVSGAGTSPSAPLPSHGSAAGPAGTHLVKPPAGRASRPADGDAPLKRAVVPSLGPLGSSPQPTEPRGAGAVVVVRGDSLWEIAQRHLGPGATTQDVAREWPRWFAANRHVIGPDPDRILPGQVLRPPAGAALGGSR